MLFYLTFRIISSVAAFLYPGYASYKTLSQRPASEAEIERWLMYWSVLGCIVGVEYLAEWLVSWIPLYYAVKTLFLLYLALPQTQGAAYVYTVHLQPLLAAHEAGIDAALASLRARATAFAQERLRALWARIAGSLAQPPAEGVAPGATAAPPTLGDPVSGPAQLAASFWRAYGPGIVASGAALLRAPPVAAQVPAAGTASAAGTPPAQADVLARRRQLEAELAALAALDAASGSAPAPAPAPVPVPPASPSLSVGSGASIRERTYSGSGRFEEVEVPSDVEESGSASGASARPAATQRASWFGWGAGSKGGYERVKSE